MTGPEHYQAAEGCMEHVDDDGPHSLALLAEAQVHATLALAAATALRGDTFHGLPEDEYEAWYKAAGQTRKEARPC